MHKIAIRRADDVRLGVGDKVTVAASEDGFAQDAVGIIVDIDDGEFPVFVALVNNRVRHYFKPEELEKI